MRAVNSKKRRHKADSTPREGSQELEEPAKRRQAAGRNPPTSQNNRSPESSGSGTRSSTPASNSKLSKAPLARSKPNKSPTSRITDRAYEAAQNDLTETLRARSIPCDPGAAHEYKDDEGRAWCTCKAGDNGLERVVCDDPDCNIIWFHKDCLRKDLKDLSGDYSESALSPYPFGLPLWS